MSASVLYDHELFEVDNSESVNLRPHVYQAMARGMTDHRTEQLEEYLHNRRWAEGEFPNEVLQAIWRSLKDLGLAAPAAGFGADYSGILVWRGEPYVEIEVESNGTISMYAATPNTKDYYVEFAHPDEILATPEALKVLSAIPRRW